MVAAPTDTAPTGARMSIADHLTEARNRLAWVAGSVVAASIGGWVLTPTAWDLLREPVISSAAASERFATIAFTSVTSAFDVTLRIAVTLGVILASPVWLYHVLAFVAPGLKRREKRFVLGFLLAAVPLFVAGCASGWIVMPHIVAMMTGFASSNDATVLTASDYLDFVLKLVLAIGVAFVLPVFLVVLNLAQILRGRTILHSWRGAILTIFMFTAIATPAADVLSMFVLAAPMVGLYFAAVAIATLNDRRVDRLQARLLAGSPSQIGA